MYYIRDYCALILSEVSIYNGLTTDYGMVAAYGKGDFVYSLFNHNTVNSRTEMESLLLEDSGLSPKILKFYDGVINVTVCVSKDVGIKGLEKYLESRGFMNDYYKHEEEAARLYMEGYFKLEKEASRLYVDNIDTLLSTITLNEDLTFNENSTKGRKIASAITMGHLRLIGRTSCASSRGNLAPYGLRINSPLDMGTIKFKGKIKFPFVYKGLAYINGGLRILTSTGKLVEPFKEVIWDIHPKFDATENYGLMSRKDLEMFMMLAHNRHIPFIEKDVHEHVILGCYKDLRDD